MQKISLNHIMTIPEDALVSKGYLHILFLSHQEICNPNIYVKC